VEISCLPKDLPEFIELDLSKMEMNESKHLSDLPLPEGVTIPSIAKGDAVVVTVHPPRAEEPEPTAEVAAATPVEGAAAPAEGAAAAAGGKPGDAKAAPAAGDAKGGAAAAPAKKEGGKK
jgi:large subunit ribosomal protein L25